MNDDAMTEDQLRVLRPGETVNLRRDIKDDEVGEFLGIEDQPKLRARVLTQGGVVLLLSPWQMRTTNVILPVDRSNQCTTSGEPPEAVRAAQQADPETGQHKSYIILCEEERAKGYKRPVRDKYIHVGVGGHEVDPNNPTRHGRTGDGCGVETRMRKDIAETFARDPGFYTSGFCIGCNKHVPNAELVWEDGSVVGS